MTNDDTTRFDHHVVISADSHCGAALRDYKPYLESRFHADFDIWADEMEAAQEKLERMFEGAGRSVRNVGIDGDPVLDADRNYSSDRRLREQEQDGVVATVLFRPRPRRLKHPATPTTTNTGGPDCGPTTGG